jgi:hypothetical protein
MLVLVPHRDFRLPLRAWSASLFSAGLPGAWSFPWVSPLALLRRPASGEELKSLAKALRQEVQRSGRAFLCGPPASVPFPSGLFGAEPAFAEPAFLYGPALNIDLSAGIFEPAGKAVICPFTLPVIGAALHYGSLPAALPSPPEISFRAAALANMHYSPLPGSVKRECHSFEWSIGTLHWLPKK